MNFSTLESLMCGVGIALFAYSRTFPVWVRERALERLLQAKETIAIMEAKLSEYEKAKTVLGQIEEEAKKDGAMPTKKDELEFALRLMNEFTRRNDELLTANAKMKIAHEALKVCGDEMSRRRWESIVSELLGIALLVAGIVMFVRR